MTLVIVSARCRFFDPAIRLVGRLSFRHKMQVTALIFGAPLIIALGIIVAGLGARVAAVAEERQGARRAAAGAHPARADAPVPGDGSGLARRRRSTRRRGERPASTQRAYAVLPRRWPSADCVRRVPAPTR